jgi:ABC-type transport system involved in multi-copper enzyme maturation permease subunit
MGTGLLRAEWIKFRSVRSSYWALLVAAVLAVAIGALATSFDASDYAKWPPPEQAAFDPIGQSLSGIDFAFLAMGVLGILVVSSEYTTGLIRTTFAATPQRRRVLAAKAAVVGAVTLLAGEVLAFTAFFLGQGVLSGGGIGVSVTAPGALRIVSETGLVLCLTALLGVGLGAILRHTAGAISAFVGLTLVLQIVVHSLPNPWWHTIGQFTYFTASHQVMENKGSPLLLSSGPSLLVCAAWVAAALGTAVYLIHRRDA